MKIDFRALNNNLDYQQHAIMFLDNLIDVDTQQALIDALNKVKKFNNDMIALYETEVVELN